MGSAVYRDFAFARKVAFNERYASWVDVTEYEPASRPLSDKNKLYPHALIVVPVDGLDCVVSNRRGVAAYLCLEESLIDVWFVIDLCVAILILASLIS